MYTEKFKAFMSELQPEDNVKFAAWNKCILKKGSNGEYNVIPTPFESEKAYTSFVEKILSLAVTKVPLYAKIDTDYNCKIVVTDTLLSTDNNYLVHIRKIS